MKEGKTIWKKNVLLVLIVVVIAIAPIYLRRDAEFAGADSEAMDMVSEIAPWYEVWAEPLLAPKSGEIESLLFALQAGLGAGVMGFVLGRITKKDSSDKK